MKTRTALTAALASSVLLAGCASDFSEIGREPGMTPVGSGLTAYHASLPAGSFPDEGQRSYHSLWKDNREKPLRGCARPQGRRRRHGAHSHGGSGPAEQ